MPIDQLTPAEQAELAQLEALDRQNTDLTPEEKAELAQLEANEVKPEFQIPSMGQLKQNYHSVIEQIDKYDPSSPENIEKYRHPETGMDDPAYQLMGLVSPGSILKPAGKLASNIGSRLMQRAVGAKKFVPGMGEALAEEGVIGTRGMMRDQVANAMQTRGQQIGKLAKEVPSVDTKLVAESLGERAAKLIGPDGKVLPENAAEFNRLTKLAGDASAEGAITGETAAFRRMQQGKIARDAGRYNTNPAQGMKAQMAGEQQAAYSNALKSSPGASPELAEADKAYSMLAQANKGLTQPDSLSGIGGTIGQLIPTSLAESALGRMLMGTGKAMGSQGPGVGIRAPATLADLLTKKATDDK